MLSYAKIHQTEEFTEIATLLDDDFHWQSATVDMSVFSDICQGG